MFLYIRERKYYTIVILFEYINKHYQERLYPKKYTTTSSRELPFWLDEFFNVINSKKYEIYIEIIILKIILKITSSIKKNKKVYFLLYKKLERSRIRRKDVLTI